MGHEGNVMIDLYEVNIKRHGRPVWGIIYNVMVDLYEVNIKRHGRPVWGKYTTSW
jgi:hypothetical protein